MNEIELKTIWNYYLIIEEDLANTARYVEPSGQENVYSFEFQKIIILACTEVEKVFKLIAKETNGKTPGNMEEYKAFMLKNFPKIVDAKVNVSRLEKVIKPFENWDKSILQWWDAYTNLKHDIKDNIKYANCINAIYTMSALYVLILYLAQITETRISSAHSKYIFSDYGDAFLTLKKGEKLPDFKT